MSNKEIEKWFGPNQIYTEMNPDGSYTLDKNRQKYKDDIREELLNGIKQACLAGDED